MGKRFRPDLPRFYGKYLDILRGLSEGQVDALLSNEHITLSKNTELDKIPKTQVKGYWYKPNKEISVYVKPPEIVLPDFDINEVKDILEHGFSNIDLNINYVEGERIGVIKIADLHFGAYVDNLIRTKEFSIDILCQKLIKASHKINRYNFKEVHIHILGDLIESFTGLNHKNSWKGLDRKLIGAEAVKLASNCLHEYLLSRINNLESVKIVAGNHDRLTSDKNEDTDGGAANLIAWGLSLIGYKVEFNPFVITDEIDGICHILTHGHHGISRRSTKDIIWDYGKQGMFNLVCEGHLHSIIGRLSVKQIGNFRTIKDDSVDCRRFNCPSFFTGNSFSEYLGYTSTSGFVATYNDGEGVPEIDYKTI